MAADEVGPRTLTRRRLLQWAAGGGAVALVGSQTGSPGLGLGPRPAGLIGDLLDALRPAAPPFVPPASLLVVRGADGLHLTFSFANLEVRPQRRGPALLALRDPSQDGHVVVTFPPQHLFEAAVPELGGGGPPTPPVPTLLADESRVVLAVPKGTGPLPYRLEALLDLDALPLVTSDVARNGADASGPEEEPGPLETAIEAPFRIVLSPTGDTRFTAVGGPVVHGGRTELWHARAVAGEDAGATPQVRAVWAKDLEAPVPAWALDEGQASLLPPQRSAIVAATTTSGANGPAAPAAARRLLLSPLGASLDIDGSWPTRLDVTAWRHRAWQGRDTYVRVEEPGFLFPLGIRAVLVSLTERVVAGGYAYLRKKTFVLVREPTIRYDGADALGRPDEGRTLPFLRATTTTVETPPLVPLAGDPAGALGPARWVRVLGPGGGPTHLRFNVELESRDGNVVRADLPLAFVAAGPAHDPTIMQAVVTAYGDLADAALRTLALGGQRVGFIPRLAPDAEDPSLPTFALRLLAETASASATELAAVRRLGAYPVMQDAEVHLEALDGLVAPGGARTTIALHTAYVGGGLPTAPAAAGAAGALAASTNLNEVWANVLSPPQLAVPQQTGGGMAAPKFDVGGLSRAHGPVAAPDEIAGGSFDPGSYFDTESITLLGAIPLSAVVAAVPSISDPRAGDGESVPKVVTSRTDTAVDTVVTWRPQLTSYKAGIFAFEPADAPDDRLDLRAAFHTDLATQATRSEVVGELRGSRLVFASTIEQPIDRLRFETRDGAKPSLDVDLGTPGFAGDLEFLSKLQEYLPALPGGVKVDVTPRGLNASMTIGLPAVPLGAVLVQNLSFGIGLELPFDGGQMVLTFSFCSREQPFRVTVMALGGGGFLGIGMGLRGIQHLEGSIEFGAAVALDFGVASGSVSIMAGIYVKFAQRVDAQGNATDPPGNSAVITGYVRALGTLDVLGLIHASIELYLGLTYRSPDKTNDPTAEGVVEGVARLTIRVEVLLFSTSVSVEMRKEFGSGIDPSFGDQISAGDWSDYCAAFAAA